MRRAVEAVQALALFAAVAAAPFDSQKPYYDSKCLLCICKTLGDGACEAGGECRTKNCFGPFRITEPYWVSADSPVQPGDDSRLPGAFRRCVEEPFCAVRTIQAHMSQGALKDFDRDGRISCIDLYIAHMFGRNYEKVPDLSSGLFPYLKKCLNWSEPVGTVAPPKPSVATSTHVSPRGATVGSPSWTGSYPSRGTPASAGARPHGSTALNGGSSSSAMAGRGNVPNAPRTTYGSSSPNTWIHGGYNSYGPTRTMGGSSYGSQSGRGY